MLSFFLPIMFILKSSISAEKLEIVYPGDKSLIGAGHFDFKWRAVSNAKTYQLYINDKLITTTEKTTYDYYTTKVQKFTAYIQVELINGGNQKSKSITFFVTKKGLAVNSNMGKNLDPLSMNMGWYYTWSPSSPFAYQDKNYKYIEFVPMIWGMSNEDTNLEIVQRGNHMYLLGYNEPDFADQSNIPYETAAEHWPKFQGKSRYLGSPVPALSPTWENGPWLNNFMKTIDQNTVDFIALHCYYGQYGGFGAAETFLKDVVDGTYKLFGKPIWITEFAVSGWGYSNVEKRKEVDDFLRGCIKGLNERDFVERYSWFSFNTDNENDGASALWTESTGQLTSLGETYVSFGNPEGYDYTKENELEIEILSFVRDGIPYSDSFVVGEKSYVNLLRKNDVKASASSSKGDTLPEHAIDNNVETRWESGWSDAEYLIVDLGALFFVKKIELMWQYASAKDYSIMVSSDGISYTNVADAYELALVEKRSESFLFKKMFQCRYIKINCHKRTTEWGYSIYEIAIYGSDASDETIDPDEPEKPGESENPNEPENPGNSDDIDNSGIEGDESNPGGSSGNDKSKLSSGAIAAIVIVVIIVVAAAIIVPIVIIRRRNMNLRNESNPSLMSLSNI